MDIRQLLVLGGIGVGGYFLWRRFAGVTAPVALNAPTNIDACLKFRPAWSRERCNTTIKALETAYANAKAKVDAYLILREAAGKVGNTAEVQRLDAEIAPWQTALAGHKSDYWKLTGVTLG